MESSRTSLGRRYGSGVGRRVSEIPEPGKVVGKAAPNTVRAALLAARIVARVQGHILVLAQPRTREMRTRSMRKKRILDELPPEVLSIILSQLLPQEMMVQKCSRRWRDKDLDVLYWKPLFLNTFGEAAQTTTTKRRKARSREWRDRYERAWRLRVEPRTSGRGGTCALGLHLGQLLSS